MEDNQQDKIISLENKIKDLTDKITRLERLQSIHTHRGYDESARIDDSIEIPDSKQFQSGPMAIAGYDVPITYDASGNVTSYGAKNFGVVVGQDDGRENNSSTILKSENAQMWLEDQPLTTSAISNGLYNWTFFQAFRPPLYQNNQGNLTVISGTAQITDTSFNWTTNSLVGAIIRIFDSTNSVFRLITSNNATTINFNSVPGFDSSTAKYLIYMPVFLGSGSVPWRRLYLAGDPLSTSKTTISNARFSAIRFDTGSSSGREVINLFFGTGTPEGSVVANIGSIYLRKDGGAGTSFYVKESQGTVITAGSFVGTPSDGLRYEIKTVGTTDFTAIGASSNTVGVIFTATGAGSGTGDAYQLNTGWIGK